MRSEAEIRTCLTFALASPESPHREATVSALTWALDDQATDTEGPVVVDLAPARSGLTLQQAQHHAKQGAKITRQGQETSWFLMAGVPPHWHLFVFGKDGGDAAGPQLWPDKQHRHWRVDAMAHDWKVLDATD